MITNRFEKHSSLSGFGEGDPRGVPEAASWAADTIQKWSNRFVKVARERPALILGIGLSAGVVLGWLTKRR